MSVLSMKQALEALEWCTAANPCASETVVKNLREAITTAEAAVPVAWRFESEAPCRDGYEIVFDYAEFPVDGAVPLYLSSNSESNANDRTALQNWFRVIDEALVSIDIAAEPDDSYEDAKRKLNQLICWNVAAATDPAVNGGFHLVPSLDPSTICPLCGGSVNAK